MKKNLVRISALILVAALMTVPALASSTAALKSVSDPIVDLINSVLGPLLAIVGALGTLYCVILGVKYAKAEEPQDREKAKSHLKNAIIGFVLIFVLMLALKLLMPALEQWVVDNAASSGMSSL